MSLCAWRAVPAPVSPISASHPMPRAPPSLPPPTPVPLAQAIDRACLASHGEFVRAQTEGPPGSAHIDRWNAADDPQQHGDPSLDLERSSQWVMARYLCTVEAGRKEGAQQIRLVWESGSTCDTFYHLSALMLNEVINLNHENGRSYSINTGGSASRPSAVASQAAGSEGSEGSEGAAGITYTLPTVEDTTMMSAF